MNKPKTTIPRPTTICDQCAKYPYEIEPTTGIYWFYCQHNAAGGLYVEGFGYWQVFSPIERDVFMVSLRGAVSVIVQQTSLQAKGEAKN